MNVTADQPARSWNSSSLLALDCVSHSVRLRYRFKSNASSWKESQTIGKCWLQGVFGSSTIITVETLMLVCILLPDACCVSSCFSVIAERTKSHLPVVYPKNECLEVGSTVSFCCIVPEAQNFSKMFVERLNASNMNTTKVSSQVYAFTFQANNETGQSCTHIYCYTTKIQSTCAYFGCEYELVCYMAH